MNIGNQHSYTSKVLYVKALTFSDMHLLRNFSGKSMLQKVNIGHEVVDVYHVFMKRFISILDSVTKISEMNNLKNEIFILLPFSLDTVHVPRVYGC